jgi:two-component system sensor histidine kinase BaeS
MGLAINLPVIAVNRVNSITYRITGLMFLAVALTVFVLIYLADEQMGELFQEYLVVQQMELHQGNAVAPMADGAPAGKRASGGAGN